MNWDLLDPWSDEWEEMRLKPKSGFQEVGISLRELIRLTYPELCDDEEPNEEPDEELDDEEFPDCR